MRRRGGMCAKCYGVGGGIFLALFVVVFVWCRRLRQARWHLQRNASGIIWPTADTEWERQRARERARILLYRCRLQNRSRVPRSASQTAIISSRNHNAFDTLAPIASAIGRGTTFFFFFFLPVQWEHFCCCCSSTSRHQMQSLWRGSLVQPAVWTKHLFISGLRTPAPAHFKFLSAALAAGAIRTWLLKQMASFSC